MSKEDKFDYEIDNGQFDEWMEKFFLDPHTNLLDAQTFRVDLFENNDEYLVEALFDDNKPEKLIVRVDENRLQIIAEIAKSCTHKYISNPLIRSISFPFSINNRKIDAEYADNILQVHILKGSKTIMFKDIVITT
ncbi:Hsp20/alpha crystallin family protein [Peribacillus sp. SCS-155]|uniref:Hsp20/alpha crystallin family protein n=1 Tax=Peribacillus sedimenti TaxID=3115297 RepID=UPI003906122D